MRYFVQEYNDSKGRPVIELRCSEEGKELPGKEVDQAGFIASWRLRDELAHQARLAIVSIVAPAQRLLDAPTMPAPVYVEAQDQSNVRPRMTMFVLGKRAA